MKKAGYEAAIEHLNQLLDAGGANQAHPLAGLVEALDVFLIVNARIGQFFRKIMQQIHIGWSVRQRDGVKIVERRLDIPAVL